MFNWNRDKFPDAKGFVKHYRDHGIRLCANIKPCLLRDHSAFEEAARLLIRSASGEPAWVQFWDEVGAYLDFTQPDAYRWWREQVTSALLEYGIESTWNDNNEYEIWSPDAIAHGFGQPYPVREAKVLQTMLMMRASRDAQRAHAPARRPFLVSRSGGAGMQRYVQAWSGDNYTSGNPALQPEDGPCRAVGRVEHRSRHRRLLRAAPSPELLLRWVQFGLFMPRFSIHSWNDDGTVNEPWMYPEITAQIASLIKQRYRLLPYLYHLLAVDDALRPVLRPTFADFPGDARCYDECDDMMLARPRRRDAARAPRSSASVTLPAPLDSPVMLLREGRVLPLNVAEQHFGARADTRGFLVAPRIEDGVAYGECVEDDGETEAWRDGEYGLWRIETGREASGAFGVSVRWDGRPARPADRVEILLPASLQARSPRARASSRMRRTARGAGSSSHSTAEPRHPRKTGRSRGPPPATEEATEPPAHLEKMMRPGDRQ